MAAIERKTKRYPSDPTAEEWRAGAMLILDAIRRRWPWMKHFFTDGAYDSRKLLDNAAFLDFVGKVVRRTDIDPGFKAIPRR